MVRSPRWFRLMLLAALLAAAPAAAQPTPDGDTLLLVPFDRSCDAAFARGRPEALGAAPLVPGRFGRGADLKPGVRLAFAGDDGNFNPQEGTIAFWMRPRWDGTDMASHTVLSCSFGERRYLNINALGNGRLGVALAAGEGEAWRWRRADADIGDWRAGQWRHVAVTWGGGRLRIYIDGREGRRTADDAVMPQAAPAEIALVGCDAVIDELCVCRRAYSAAELRRRIDAALAPPRFRWLDDLLTEAGREELAQPYRIRLGGVRIPLLLGGQRYWKCFGIPVDQSLTLELDGRYAKLAGQVGLDTLSPPEAACRFEVWGDDRLLWRSAARRPSDPPLQLDVPLAGVRRLKLASWLTRRSPAGAVAVWAAAAARGTAAPVTPPPRKLAPETVAMYRRQAAADRYTFPPNWSGAYVVARTYWEDDLDPSQPPPADRLGGPLVARAAPGEYEPVSFVVYAAEDLRRVTVEVTELQSDHGAISPEAADVRLVLRGLMRDVYTLPPERSTVVSRFLLPNRPVRIPRGEFRQYHIILHAPPDAEPGRYLGAVRLGVTGGRDMDVPLELHVLPLRLRPLEENAYGVYYRFPPDEADWPKIEHELEDIRRHGASLLKSPLGVRVERDEAGRPRPSVQRLRRGLELLRRHGFHGPLPVTSGAHQAARALDFDPVADWRDEPARRRFFALVKEGLDQLAAVGRAFPEFELLPTHMDEVFKPGLTERYIRLTEAVRQASSLRVYITLHNSPRRGAAELMRLCDPYVDVRCYNGHAMDEWIAAGHRFDELRRELDAAGDEAWTYYNIRGSFFQAKWTRFVNGFYLWISPLRVHVPWMYYSYKGNPLDDTDGPRLRGHDFAYAVPDPEDPRRLVSTRHWEAFREGVDDMRRLRTLEQLLAERPGDPAAEEARAWLERLRRELEPRPDELRKIAEESPILRSWSAAWDGARLARFRREIEALIMRLTPRGDSGASKVEAQR